MPLLLRSGYALEWCDATGGHPEIFINTDVLTCGSRLASLENTGATVIPVFFLCLHEIQFGCCCLAYWMDIPDMRKRQTPAGCFGYQLGRHPIVWLNTGAPNNQKYHINNGKPMALPHGIHRQCHDAARDVHASTAQLELAGSANWKRFRGFAAIQQRQKTYGVCIAACCRATSMSDAEMRIVISHCDRVFYIYSTVQSQRPSSNNYLHELKPGPPWPRIISGLANASMLGVATSGSPGAR